MGQQREIFVFLGRVGDALQGRLLSARLESEGIAVRMRTEAAGPYPFTVGDMAVADLFVSEHDLEDAQEIMMAAEVDNILGGIETGREFIPPWSWRARLLALTVALIIVALFVRRFVLLVTAG